MKKKFGMFAREVVIYPDHITIFNYPKDEGRLMYVLVTRPTKTSLRNLLDVLKRRQYPCSPIMDDDNSIIRYVFKCGASKRR